MVDVFGYSTDHAAPKKVTDGCQEDGPVEDQSIPPLPFLYSYSRNSAW